METRMRIWNLNEPADLAENVVAPLPANSHLVRPRASLRTQKAQSLKIVVGIASLALTIYVDAAVVNSDFVRLPSWAAAVSKSAPDLQGPLDSVFRGRFSSGWTETEEGSLLGEIVTHRPLVNKPKTEPTRIARLIFSNQQENINRATS